MSRLKIISRKGPAEKWILAGIPILFIIGSFMHFAFKWSGSLPAIGIFAPVNESVWEHLKLAFWPVLAWWIIGYFVFKKANPPPLSQWMVACAAALGVSLLFIVSFFYTYTGALGIESLILDILSLLFGLAFGQIVALHVYKYSKKCIFRAALSAGFILILAAAFAVFTFCPPHFPLFMDSQTGTYGIGVG